MLKIGEKIIKVFDGHLHTFRFKINWKGYKGSRKRLIKIKEKPRKKARFLCCKFLIIGCNFLIKEVSLGFWPKRYFRRIQGNQNLLRACHLVLSGL